MSIIKIPITQTVKIPVTHYKIPLTQSLHVQVLPEPLCVALWELGFRNLAKENGDTLAMARAMNKSFVSDSGVSCLLQAFMKLWQGSLLASKYDKISDP